VFTLKQLLCQHGARRAGPPIVEVDRAAS
jgi:hypothetical protein